MWRRAAAAAAAMLLPAKRTPLSHQHLPLSARGWCNNRPVQQCNVTADRSMPPYAAGQPGRLLALDQPPPPSLDETGSHALQHTSNAGMLDSVRATLTAVAVPPLPRNLGPRVEHIQVTGPGRLCDVVAAALELPASFVAELLRFGAIYYCPVMPPPSPKIVHRMSREHLDHVAALRAAGKARHGRSSDAETPRRCLADRDVDEGGYIRVHVHPKRFPAAHGVDWASRVLAVRRHCVVVDKPPGVQVPPTVDNVLESVAACTAAALGWAPDALANTHRLDVGTSGVVVLSRSAHFSAWFTALLGDKQQGGAVVKTYHCLTAAPPPLGRLVHWAVIEQRQAGEPAHTRILLPSQQQQQQQQQPEPLVEGCSGGGDVGADGPPPCKGAVRCELIVQQVERVGLTGDAARQWGDSAFESTLQLVTGRTHQIRAQMAAVACPLLGDQLYTALAAIWQQQGQGQGQQQQDQQQQQPQQDQPQQGQQQPAQQQQQPHGGQQLQQQVPLDQQPQPQHRHAGAFWSTVYQEDPSRPIGLQAARLRVRDPRGWLSRTDQDDAAQQQLRGPDSAHEAGAAGEPSVARTREQQEGQHTDGGEWVEFAAGVPWWRAGTGG